MSIGDKVKKLRTEKMMTQSQLAGDEITRNMLSRIESGCALPSLPTLEYLAKRLNVPSGYLLADEAEDEKYNKAFIKEELKRSYASDNFRICRSICLDNEIEDDEYALIACESMFSVAVEEFDRGRLKFACAHFDEALMRLEKTAYSTEHIKASAAAYFRYMRMISRTLSSGVIDENSVEYYASMSNDFCRYIHAIESLDTYSTAFAASYVISGDGEDPKVLHVGAKIDIMNNDHRSAYNRLIRILHNNYEICRPLLYLTLCDIEHCCEELHDHKGVYEYSNMRSELLQRLLSEE